MCWCLTRLSVSMIAVFPVQLWTVGNYHWYLKQSMDFGRSLTRAPACVCWDLEVPLRLHLVTRGWLSLTYDWAWSTDRSVGEDAQDDATVAVIDGGESQSGGDPYDSTQVVLGDDLINGRMTS